MKGWMLEKGVKETGIPLQTMHYIPVQAFFIFTVLQKVFSHSLWELCFVVKYFMTTGSRPLGVSFLK